MPKLKKPKEGDILEIPLSDGTRALCRYVLFNPRLGAMVEVFQARLSADAAFASDNVDIRRLLFPPVFVGLHAAIRTGGWREVGHIPVGPYPHPMFLSVDQGRDPFTVTAWFLFDGNNYKRIGRRLPGRYRRLEMLGVWAAQDLAKRIETGIDPFRSRLNSAE